MTEKPTGEMILSYTTTFHMFSYAFTFMTKIMTFKRKNKKKTLL